MPDLGAVTMAEFLGQDSQGFLAKLTAANLDEPARRYIIGEYIREKVGKNLRTFAFSAASSVAAAPSCQPAFAPTFAHREWKDGEDLVVAEGIAGFNVRFNALKADLDGIRADLVNAFQCLASLQQAVANGFVEITAEFNAVNRQIYDCCSKSGDGPTVAPPVRNPRWADILPEVQPGILGPAYGPPVNPMGPYSTPKLWRDAADPNKGMIAGMEAARIDVTVMNGKPMDVWKTQMGLILTESAAAPEAVRPGFVPTELERARDFARFLGDNEAEIAEALPDRFTARDFKDKFGATRLAGGMPLADLMKGLPDDMAFESTAGLADAVTDATATSVADAGLGQPTIVGTIGLNAGAEISNVPVESLKAVDERTAAALREAGITTLGQLSEAEPARLRDTLEGAGIRTTVGDAAGLRGLGRAITRVGRMGTG